MQKLDEKEVREIQLQILDVVADFCEKNQINYWLDYGTLLGAVRHKGFIPWDDDIDLGMLRADFNTFTEKFNECNERYQLICPEKNRDCPYCFGKVLDTQTVLYEPDIYGNKTSINIDIFAYDNAPVDARERNAMYKKVNRNLVLNMLKHNLISDKGKWYRKVAKSFFNIILKPFAPDYFIKKIRKIAGRYEKQDTGLVGCFQWGMPFVCDKKVVESFSVKVFEGRNYKVPVDYDCWLQRRYGDYMQLPPPEQRVTHHRYEAFMV